MQKNSRSQANEFLLHTVGALEIFWKINKKIILKNIQVQLMNFYYINVEAMGKCVIIKKNQFWKKKNTSPAKEFLLHTVEAIGKLK